jgi:hypothetical protein
MKREQTQAEREFAQKIKSDPTKSSISDTIWVHDPIRGVRNLRDANIQAIYNPSHFGKKKSPKKSRSNKKKSGKKSSKKGKKSLKKGKKSAKKSKK